MPLYNQYVFFMFVLFCFQLSRQHSSQDGLKDTSTLLLKYPTACDCSCLPELLVQFPKQKPLSKSRHENLFSVCSMNCTVLHLCVNVGYISMWLLWVIYSKCVDWLFYMWLFSFPIIILWRCFVFSLCFLLNLVDYIFLSLWTFYSMYLVSLYFPFPFWKVYF